MPIVDARVLATLEELGGRELLDEMLEAATAGIETQIAEIAASASSGDLDGVARAAHGLKSTAGAVGATRLLEAATAIEAEARAGRIDPADPEIVGLRREFRAFEDEAASFQR